MSPARQNMKRNSHPESPHHVTANDTRKNDRDAAVMSFEGLSDETVKKRRRESLSGKGRQEAVL